MAAGGRATARARFLRRVALLAAGLALVALLLLTSGHWVLALVVGAAAAAAIWLLVQTRRVR